MSNDIKPEYDLSNATRGKFYKPNLRLIPPVRLEPDVLDFLATRAQQRGTTVNQLINSCLRKILSSFKWLGKTNS